MARKERIVEGDPRFNNRPKPPVIKDEVVTEEAPLAQKMKETVKLPPTKKAILSKKKKKVDTKPKGGVLATKTTDQIALEKVKQDHVKASKNRIKRLNECALFMLSCLEPGFCADWIQAAEEQRVKDVGVYMLGVLNRLSKMVDYMESDIETEWDQGLVGYNESLFCEYCKKEIEITKKTHLRQRFCSNLCAKRYKDSNTTGIVYPDPPNGPTEAQIEEKQWRHEARLEGVLVDG